MLVAQLLVWSMRMMMMMRLLSATLMDGEVDADDADDAADDGGSLEAKVEPPVFFSLISSNTTHTTHTQTHTIQRVTGHILRTPPLRETTNISESYKRTKPIFYLRINACGSGNFLYVFGSELCPW